MPLSASTLQMSVQLAVQTGGEKTVLQCFRCENRLCYVLYPQEALFRFVSSQTECLSDARTNSDSSRAAQGTSFVVHGRRCSLVQATVCDQPTDQMDKEGAVGCRGRRKLLVVGVDLCRLSDHAFVQLDLNTELHCVKHNTSKRWLRYSMHSEHTSKAQ